jgi:uncharacterized protein DUF4082
LSRKDERKMNRKLVISLLGFLFTFLVSVNECLSETVSIFNDNVLSQASEGNQTPITVGVKFWSNQSGTISAIRFYRGTTSPLGYVARLYSASGTILGSVTMARESGPVPGWQVATFAAPIPISANITYVAAYYVPSGEYMRVLFGLTQGVQNGPLIAPASASVDGNGVYRHNLGFPTDTANNANYLADVVFTPSGPYLMLSVNPGNPTIPSNARPGTVVATITASWSDGSPFTGRLSFAPPYSNDQGVFAISGNNLIINPSGPGVSADANTVQHVTIAAAK